MSLRVFAYWIFAFGLNAVAPITIGLRTMIIVVIIGCGNVSLERFYVGVLTLVFIRLICSYFVKTEEKT